MGDLGSATLGGYCRVCGSYELDVVQGAAAIDERVVRGMAAIDERAALVSAPAIDELAVVARRQAVDEGVTWPS